MTMTEMQGCLSRLYVDEAFRKLFHLAPDSALEGYRLTKEEDSAIRSLDRMQLDSFAIALVNKRRKRFERAYPLLFGIDGPEISRYFARFHQIAPSPPYQDVVTDIMAFGVFLEQSLVGSPLPAFAGDLARYERQFFWARTTISPPGPASRLVAESMPSLSKDVRIAEFDYDVGAIEDALQAGVAPEEIDPGEPCSIIFCPASGAAAARMLRINRPTKVILDLCNGRRNLQAITAEAEKAFSSPGLAEAVREALERLLEPRVLTLQAPTMIADPIEAATVAAVLQTESM